MDAFVLLSLTIGGLMDYVSVLPKIRQLHVSPRAIEARIFRLIISAYSRKKLQRTFRIFPVPYEKLLYRLHGDLLKFEEMDGRLKWLFVETDVRLGVNMRMLEGASYLDIISVTLFAYQQYALSRVAPITSLYALIQIS